MKAFPLAHLPMALLAHATSTWSPCLPCHLKLQTYHLRLPWKPAEALPRKCKHIQIAPTQKVLSLKALAHPHLPMALLAQAHKQWGYALALQPQTSNIASGSLPDTCCSPAPKVQTSPHRSHTEGATLESSCSASYAHGTACTGTKSPRLCTCPATSNLKHSMWVYSGHLLEPCFKSANVSR